MSSFRNYVRQWLGQRDDLSERMTRAEREIRRCITLISYVQRTGDDVMTRLGEMNARIGAFANSLTAMDDAIDVVKSALTELKNTPKGDPDAAAAADAAAAVLDEAKAKLDSDHDELVRAASDAVASGGAA